MDSPLKFTKIGPNAARSNEGIIVSRISRHNIEYRAGEKRLLIEVEPGEGLAIYRSSVKSWLPPFEKEVLTDDEVATVIENVCLALEFLQIKYVLDF